MTVPSKVDVDAATRETLAGLALSDPELLLVLLLLEVREALVLLVLRVLRFLRFPGHMPARRVRATTDHGRAHQWASSPDHDLPPS